MPNHSTLNRSTTNYAITTITPADISCICGDETDTSDTIRCTLCSKHQHKTCLPDLDLDSSGPNRAKRNHTLDTYACFSCRPHAHYALMTQVAEDCQDNKESIRDILEPVVWEEYCSQFGLSANEENDGDESQSFGVSWRTGLGRVLGKMTAVEVQVLSNRMENEVSVELLREFVGRVKGREYAGLEVLAEVLGLRHRGSLWSEEGGEDTR